MHLDEAGAGQARSGTGENPGGSWGMPTREVRFFAAARDAAGESGTSVVAGTVEELKDELIGQYGESLARVLGVSSLLVDGQVLAVRGPVGQELPGAGVVDVLPPFAGG